VDFVSRPVHFSTCGGKWNLLHVLEHHGPVEPSMHAEQGTPFSMLVFHDTNTVYK